MKSPGIRVAVLRGGPSYDYSASLKTGEHVLSALRETPQYHPIDIFISKAGEWHREGLVEEPHQALRHVDVVWNALHGPYGEDGQVQRVLEGLRIPFTGSSTLASALAMNKEVAKDLYQRHSLATPAHTLVTESDLNTDKLVTISRNYIFPVVVKPANASGSLGVTLAHNFLELGKKIRDTFHHSPRVLVEEFVRGTEASCAVLEGVKGEKFYALAPVAREALLHPTDMKRKKKISIRLGSDEIRQIEDMAKRAHEALGLSHYSASDFIITPKRKIYILETNSQPVLQNGSPLFQSLSGVGWRHEDFVDHIIKLAL